MSPRAAQTVSQQ